jgi:protein-tyrosine phosphatase/lysophospholipase L1-like esterase
MNADQLDAELLTQFYQQHQPEKIPEVSQLMGYYSRDDLTSLLLAKYKKSPQWTSAEGPSSDSALNSTRGSEVVVVVLGSSVAEGYSAQNLNGWASILAKALPAPLKLVNVSECGSNTQRTANRFMHVVPQHKPMFVVISLSLANEGLLFGGANTCADFEAGLKRLVALTQSIGAQPIFGSVYPNNEYAPDQYKLLLATHRRMMAGSTPVIDFLSALDDGRGHWKADTECDAGHPNDSGHQLMAAVAVAFFSSSHFLASVKSNNTELPAPAVPTTTLPANLPANLPTTFALSDIVRIDGLQKAAKYNGKMGLVVGGKLLSGRLPVRLQGSEKVLQVQVANLTLKARSSGGALIWHAGTPHAETADSTAQHRKVFEGVVPVADLVYESRSSGGKVFLGDLYTASHANYLRAKGISHVLNCAREINIGGPTVGIERSGSRAPITAALPFEYCKLDLGDSTKEDIEDQWMAGVNFMAAAVEAGGGVFVHCVQGKSRSAACVLAFMLLHGESVGDESSSSSSSSSGGSSGGGGGGEGSDSSSEPEAVLKRRLDYDGAGGLSLQQCYQQVQLARPKIKPNTSFLLSLLELEESLHGCCTLDLSGGSNDNASGINDGTAAAEDASVEEGLRVRSGISKNKRELLKRFNDRLPPQ